MRRRLTSLSCAAWVLLSGAALAQATASPDAVALMEAEVAEACGGGSGHQITTNGFVEHDLTGDGVRDLLVQHSDITCAGGARSGFCGVQVCTFKIWVRQNGQLVPVVDSLGIVTAISGTPIPDISIYPHGGPEYLLRWTGAGFQPVGN